MKDAIKQFLLGFFYTFTNDNRGNSARKTTAFALMICVFFIHWEYINFDNAISALLIDLAFVGLLFGILHADDIRTILGKDKEK
jgi:hypothetical protein